MLKRFVVRLFLAAAFASAVAAISIVFRYPDAYRPEIWAVAAAALAVIPAALATWSTQRMLELEEDASAPFPYPSFDSRSRSQLLQLRIENHGKGIARNVYLEWKDAPSVRDGGPPPFLTAETPVPILLPGRDASYFVDGARDFVKKHDYADFSGKVHFQDIAGRAHSHPFVLPTSHLKDGLSYDDEISLTHRELQKLPDALEKISKTIEKVGGR